MTQTIESNQKILTDKIAEVDKKLGENQSKIEKEKVTRIIIKVINVIWKIRVKTKIRWIKKVRRV